MPPSSLNPYDKNILRDIHLARRRALPVDDHDAASAGCVRNLVKLIGRLPSARIAAGYVPIKGEVNITRALVTLRAEGIAIVLPRITSLQQPLHFSRWKEEDVLAPGLFGIPAPCQQSEKREPDVVIVPVVAFNRMLHRLGYGAGCYDRTLRSLRERRRVIAIGAAFAMQEEPAFTPEAHDEALDFLVTEKEIITFPPSVHP